MNLENLTKAELITIIEKLLLRVTELESRLNQDSSNSSKPPSSDPLYKRPYRTSTGKSTKKKSGGQKGHKGYQLKKFEKVDYIVDHQLSHCPHCQSCDLETKGTRTRQVADIPEPRLEITEHKLYAYECRSCGQSACSELWDKLKQEVQYGVRIKGLVNYLNIYQLIPYKRLTDLIGVLYGHRISQGSISNFNAALFENLAPFEEQLKKSFINTVAVMHSDETGCMVDKALQWMHVYSDSSKTLLKGHTKRGREAMDSIGILSESTGIVVHDRWASYSSFEGIKHALCNAHLLRDLKSVECEQLSWPSKIKKLLLRAKAYKEDDKLDSKKANRLQLKYESILLGYRSYYHQLELKIKAEQKRKTKLKRSVDHNLFNAMWKYRKNILMFIHDPNVPFDNNLAERDLRMLKVKMKVSNQFKTLEWMNIHARIRSFISTVHKQELNIFQYILMAHQNPITVLHLAV